MPDACGQLSKLKHNIEADFAEAVDEHPMCPASTLRIQDLAIAKGAVQSFSTRAEATTSWNLQMSTMRCSRFLSLLAVLFAVGGCASTTTVQLDPSPQEPVCAVSATALILWMPEWRADQKDVLAREAAAADGLSKFFERSGCFESVSIERLPLTSEEAAQVAAADATKRNDKVVLIAVRELGPIVKIGASAALVEGGTEVVLGVSEFMSGMTGPRTFTVQWRSGGPGVVKGVASLPQDMQAALAAGLQPPVR